MNKTLSVAATDLARVIDKSGASAITSRAVAAELCSFLAQQDAKTYAIPGIDDLQNVYNQVSDFLEGGIAL